jgi:hypothetical protein
LLGVELPADKIALLVTGKAWKTMFSNTAKKKATQAAIKGGWKGLTKTLFAYATFGLSIWASAELSAYHTRKLGWDAATVARDWLSLLLLEGSTFMSSPRKVRCYFKTAAAMMCADNEVSEFERDLFVAFLSKPYYFDESNLLPLTKSQRLEYAELARLQCDADSQVAMDESLVCIEDEFRLSLPQHKFMFLNHLFPMLVVDWRETDEERDFFHDVEEKLKEMGLFDGTAITKIQLAYAQQAMRVLFHPNTIELPEEYEYILAGMTPKDIIDGIQEPNPEVEQVFLCGFGGECD